MPHFLRTFRRLLVLGAAITSACLSAADPPDSPPPGRVIQVEVMDSSGAPVRGSFVRWVTYPYDPASDIFFERADSLGVVAVDLGDVSPASLDSVRFDFRAPGCGGSGQWHQTSIDAPTFFDIASDTSTLGLILDSLLPPARTAPGEYCARGYPSGWFGLDIYLALRVDSLVGPLIYGRWETGYNSTRSGDVGSFVGGYGPTFVVLNLVVDRQWNTCAGFRLTATVHPDGTWGEAAITEENGCDTVPMYFDFVEEDTFFGF